MKLIAASVLALTGAAFLVAPVGATVTPTPAPAPAVLSHVGAPDHADTAFASIGDAATVPPATWTAAEYDGKQFTTNQPDLNTLPKVHAVYMYANEAANRFGTYAAYFQAEDRRANALLSTATGMGFRWDERKDATGRLVQDITVVHAKSRLKVLAGTGQFSAVGTELANAGLKDPNTKYFVWLDADSLACGQSQAQTDTKRTVLNAANGTSYSIAYRPSVMKPTYDANGGWCNPVTHELTHAIGGVLSVAAHYEPGGHCLDDGNDIMCNASAGKSTQPYSTSRPRTYDGSSVSGGAGDDDYLDPAADLANAGNPLAGKLGYWAVNLSRYLCPRAVPFDPTKPTTYSCGVANQPAY